jgi:hypothetical protein
LLTIEKLATVTVTASPVATVYAVRVTLDGAFAGYVAPTFNSFGELGALTPDAQAALKVSFEVPSGTQGSLSQVNLLALNFPTYNDIPLIGLVSGFANTNDNLKPGSFNYAYFCGVARTAPGSFPQGVDNSFNRATGIPRNAESAVVSLPIISTIWTSRGEPRCRISGLTGASNVNPSFQH